MMLDRACAQLMEKQRDIHEKGKKIKKFQFKKFSSKAGEIRLKI